MIVNDRHDIRAGFVYCAVDGPFDIDGHLRGFDRRVVQIEFLDVVGGH